MNELVYVALAPLEDQLPQRAPTPEPSVNVASDAVLRWGWTLDDVHRLAHRAANSVPAVILASVHPADRYEAAWSAIAEAIYVAPADGPAPTEWDLMGAGMRAIPPIIAEARRDRGLADKGIGHAAYWLDPAGRYAPSPELGVVERMALGQIWPRLAPRHQRILAALATAGTYQGAAELLGLTISTVRGTVGEARHEYLRLWHEHEQPSRPWAISRAPRDPEKALRRALRRRGRRTS